MLKYSKRTTSKTPPLKLKIVIRRTNYIRIETLESEIRTWLANPEWKTDKWKRLGKFTCPLN